MIIKSLRASNFMKFSEIRVTDLPEKGEIAVIGENEAGKTTLGECIAFALFGRTVRTEDSDPGQVINWSADDCRTAIDIRISEKGVFRIERMVSRGGTLAARIVGPDGNVLAEDVHTVNEMLPRILGFNFPEFRYSFYVAQKEIDIIRHARRDNTRQIVYDMLGISAVKRASQTVEQEIQELKQRSETLDRDLAVAKALRTSVAIDEATLKRYDQEKLKIEDSIGTALADEQGADAELKRARQAVEAHRVALQTFDQFQRAFMEGHYRRYLSRFVPSFEAAAKATKAVVEKSNQDILRDENSYKHTVTKLSKIRSATVLVKELKALVDSRHNYLASELKERESTGADFVPKTKAEFKTMHERRSLELQGRLKTNIIFLIVFALLGLAGLGVGGGAFAGSIPMGENLPLGMDAKQVGLLFGLLGLVFLGIAVSVFLRRGSYAGELKNTEETLENLRQTLQKYGDESSACAAFSDGNLSDIEAQVRRINNEVIERKFEELQTKARDVLQHSTSIDSLLKNETEKEQSLRETRDQLQPLLNLTSRVRRMSEDGASRINKALEGTETESFPVLPKVQEQLEKKDYKALEACIEELLREATQGLMALDSLTATSEAGGGVSEAARALHQSLLSHFQLQSNGSEQQSNYESRSRLPKLLKPQSENFLSPDEVREALQQESKLLKEILGSERNYHSAVKTAEDTYLSLREQRVNAENKRVALNARSENIREQSARYEEFTVKIAGLENALNPLSQDLAVRQELVKLYAETVEGMKARFGPNVARYIELLLPQITRNRYRKVQITPDLDIRVFSNERNDFVKLIDLSFGTSDQILLALRLGLAQALVHSRGIRNGDQFMFLDEPLAAFDESRSQAFLQLMRTFDDNFSQIFVSSTSDINGDFDKVITLRAQNDELVVGA